MRTIHVAFDVDGTLRCNCTETCQDPNQSTVDMFMLLSKLKNVELYVWSGGGADYAAQFAELYGLPVKRSRCIGKIGAPRMDICFDDQHETDLAEYNLIVRNK